MKRRQSVRGIFRLKSTVDTVRQNAFVPTAIREGTIKEDPGRPDFNVPAPGPL